MGYHPRIETDDHATFVTTRTRNSELWFANNEPVEKFTLGLLAKVADRYRTKLYAFTIEGSHYHSVLETFGRNRSDFTRDLNSGMARGVARFTPHFDGGRLWARRYSGETVAGTPDIEAQFFYTVLQPVKDGLVDKISEYPGYNCFHDAVCGIERKYKIVNYTKYHAAKRFNPSVHIKDYIETYTLRYKRLPGYENLTQHEYRVLMEKKLEEHRQAIIEQRRAEGKPLCVGRAALLKVVPGTRAKNPKKSTRSSHRPRVLSVSHERRAAVKKWYFGIYFTYRQCSRRFLAGEIDIEFPPGTYRPSLWMVTRPSGEYSPL